MLFDEAREFARRESASAIHVHHLLLACADRADSPAGQMLRECGWQNVEEPDAGATGGAAQPQVSSELGLHLVWVNGLRTAVGPSADFGLGFLISCVLGPTSSAHRWLQRRGVDLDQLCDRASSALGLPASTCERRRGWSPDPLIVAAEDVARVTQDLRARGLKYMFNVRPDGGALIIPEESR